MNKQKTLTEYINSAPKESQLHLKQMRRCLKKVLPKAKEEVKWSMGAFSLTRTLVMFGGFKSHIGFYPTPSAMKEFKKELSKYKTGRGSIQFPHDKPLPLALISKIAKQRYKESVKEDKKWM